MSSSSETKKLTEEEKRQIDLQRRDFFKGTIAIIVIYGVFILAISILGIVSESGRNMVFVNGFSFTVTFISGTILVIILLLIQLFNYESAPPPAKYTGENLSCPDYWVLKETDKAQLDKIRDSHVRQLSRYYCKDPSKNLDTDIVLPARAAGEEQSLAKLREISQNYNFAEPVPAAQRLSQDYHMKCDRMYPDYMAYVDKTTFKDNPTAVRCEYLKQCRSQANNPQIIPWTSVCPNMPAAVAAAAAGAAGGAAAGGAAAGGAAGAGN